MLAVRKTLQTYWFPISWILGFNNFHLTSISSGDMVCTIGWCSQGIIMRAKRTRKDPWRKYLPMEGTLHLVWRDQISYGEIWKRYQSSRCSTAGLILTGEWQQNRNAASIISVLSHVWPVQRLHSYSRKTTRMQFYGRVDFSNSERKDVISPSTSWEQEVFRAA